MNDKPWGQLPGESTSAYKRFLFFRNEGVGRTLRAAFIKSRLVGSKAQRNAMENAIADGSEINPSGAWTSDSAQFDWVERANLWDIANLEKHGEESVLLFVESVRELAQKTRNFIKKTNLKDWGGALEALKTLGSFMSEETIAEVASQGYFQEEEEQEKGEKE